VPDPLIIIRQFIYLNWYRIHRGCTILKITGDRHIWNAGLKRTKKTATAPTSRAAGNTNAVNASTITGRMTNCPHVFSARNRSGRMTGQSVIL